jgi:hypothetical protein
MLRVGYLASHVCIHKQSKLIITLNKLAAGYMYLFANSPQ